MFMRALSTQDLNDLLNGACILGSGGGGPLTIGAAMVKDIETFQTPVQLADVTDVPATAQMAVSAYVGSPDAAASGNLNLDVGARAWDILAGFQNTAFSYVLPGEVGAGNSLAPMTVAVRKQIPVVDAAGARRAIPHFLQCTYAGNHIPISPMAIAGPKQQVVLSQMDNSLAEPISRGAIQGVFNDATAVAFWSMTGETMSGAAVAGTTSYAIGLGAALRTALAAGADPVETVLGYLGGMLLFTGTIVSAGSTTQDTLDYGTVTLTDGMGETVTIFNQNENLIAWSNRQAQPLGMGPDLLCYLTTKGQVFSNADFALLPKDAEVALIGVPSIAAMRTPYIIGQFLKALVTTGYAGAYIPIEQLWSSGPKSPSQG
jgi:DUF917 family protein